MPGNHDFAVEAHFFAEQPIFEHARVLVDERIGCPDLRERLEGVLPAGGTTSVNASPLDRSLLPLRESVHLILQPDEGER